jgi:glycerol kinase
MVIVSIDLGTTGNRAIAFSLDGNVVAEAYREFPLYHPQVGWVEQDPMEIWESCLAVVSEVIGKVGASSVAVVGITNQRETTVVWDRDTGRPIYPAIVWQCRRTASICEGLSEYREKIKAKTGLMLDPYFSGTKLKWILDTVPGARDKADKGQLAFGTIDSWIIWNLTQGRRHVTDTTNASRTMLFNIHTDYYDDDLLSWMDVPKSVLPEVLSCDADFGTCQLFDTPIPIQAVMGDQHSALFGQGGFEEGVVKNTYGTGLFVMASTGQIVADSPHLVSTVAWKLGNTITYALEGSIFTGGSLIQWMRDGLGVIQSASETEALAMSVESSNGVIVIPALTGLGAPYWNPYATGRIEGLTRGTTKAHIVRACLESLAFQTKDVLDVMMPFLHSRNTSLRVDGGACQNNFLMQCQSNLLGWKVERPAYLETTAFGVALLAGISTGLLSVSDVTRLRRVDTVFTPTPSPTLLQEYERWKGIMTSL